MGPQMGTKSLLGKLLDKKNRGLRAQFLIFADIKLRGWVPMTIKLQRYSSRLASVTNDLKPRYAPNPLYKLSSVVPAVYPVRISWNLRFRPD